MENTTCYCCDHTSTSEIGIRGVMQPICQECEQEIMWHLVAMDSDYC